MSDSTSGYLLARPAATRRIPATAFSASFARRFAHPVRKAAYFALREGPSVTWRKYISKRLERTIEAGLQLIVARIDLDDRSLVAMTRDLGGPLRVEEALLFDCPRDLDLESVRLTPAIAEMFESYLPVDECPLGAGLARAVLAENPRLTTATAGSVYAAVEAGALERQDSVRRRPTVVPSDPLVSSEAPGRRVFFIGFGGYVREVVLPHFEDLAGAACDYRATLISKAQPQAFPLYSDAESLLVQVEAAVRPLVVIATYHSSHASLAAAVLAANPGAWIFVEKPAGVTAQDIETLVRLRREGYWIDIGFNRRYAPMTEKAREFVRPESSPFTLVCSARENAIPSTHWYLWPNQGTRVTGNLTHWIDLSVALAGCAVTNVVASGSPERAALVIAFDNGSVATLAASVDGDPLRGVQEEIEIRSAARTLRIHDFTSMEVISGGSRRCSLRVRRQKGHDTMYRSLRQRWLEGGPPLYPAADLVRVQHILMAALAQLE